jgi:hypothetical protein
VLEKSPLAHPFNLNAPAKICAGGGEVMHFLTNLFRFTLFCYTLDITVEETMASSEAQLKQALEQLNEGSRAGASSLNPP